MAAKYKLPAWATQLNTGNVDYGLRDREQTDLSGTARFSTIGWGGPDLSTLPGYDPAALDEASVDAENPYGNKTVSAAKLKDYLAANGLQLKQAAQQGEILRWIEDDQGNVVHGDPVSTSTDDETFWTGALAAGALVGGATANWAAAGNGLGAAAPAAVGAAPPPVWNAALAESAVGTAGYGASSAGVGGGAGVLSGAAGAAEAGIGALPAAAPGATPLQVAAIEAAAPAAGTDLLANAATTGLSSADKAALIGGTNYGPVMPGLQTSAFDTVLGATGSGALANAASTVTGAAESLVSSATSSSLLQGLQKNGLTELLGGGQLGKDLMSLFGAGVNQWNIERLAKDTREFNAAEKQKDRDNTNKIDADKRRRMMPTNLAGRSSGVLSGAARVIPGG